MMTDEELRERVDGAQAYKARPNGHAEHDEPRPELPPLKVRSMADLQGKPVPPLRYIANEWIPRGKAVLLSGRGGGGKTTLACQLGAARAIGANFLGLAVDGGTSCAFMCEEDEEDAHRALAKLAGALRARDQGVRLLPLPRALGRG